MVLYHGGECYLLVLIAGFMGLSHLAYFIYENDILDDGIMS